MERTRLIHSKEVCCVKINGSVVFLHPIMTQNPHRIFLNKYCSSRRIGQNWSRGILRRRKRRQIEEIVGENGHWAG